MITDKLANAKYYYNLSEKIKKGFLFLEENELDKMSDGRYDIYKDEIFANIQSLQTKPEDEKKWEVHRKYIDIQYLIKGSERYGYGFLDDFKQVEIPYDDKKDVEFKNGERFSFINLTQGEFIIFFPSDIHAPMLKVDSSQTIKKVIVKIAL